MKEQNHLISRRRFLETSARGAAARAVAGTVMAVSARWGWTAGAGKKANPFAYDIERLARTDPRLVQYEQVGRFRSPDPEPRRLALGPEGRLYLATKTGVCVTDSAGAQVNDISLGGPARCVAVAGDGTIYAGLRDHVEVFDPKGRRLAAWETPGKRTWLSGLTVGERDVFAADSGNRVVLRYDKSGKLMGRIGEKNKVRNVPGLIVPSPYLDVKLGRDGLLRVNNPGRHCVEVYTTSGDLELSWGKPSAAIEGFCGCCNPVGLALLPDGRCITCEKGLPRVKVYAAGGAFECVVAGPESFPENARVGSVHDLSDGTMGGLDAAADGRRRVYILDIVAGDVRVMKRKG